MKNEYLLIWVEGFSWRRGEKLAGLHWAGNELDREYTTLIHKSLHIKWESVKVMNQILAKVGVTGYHYIEKSYCPTGKLVTLAQLEEIDRLLQRN